MGGKAVISECCGSASESLEKITEAVRRYRCRACGGQFLLEDVYVDGVPVVERDADGRFVIPVVEVCDG